MTTSDINLNQAACIQAVNNIGSTVYHNICTNTSSSVPWGTLDWFGAVLAGGLLGVLVLAIAWVVFNIALDW